MSINEKFTIAMLLMVSLAAATPIAITAGRPQPAPARPRPLTDADRAALKAAEEKRQRRNQKRAIVTLDGENAHV